MVILHHWHCLCFLAFGCLGNVFVASWGARRKAEAEALHATLLRSVSSGLLLSVFLLTCKNLHPQDYASQPSKSIVYSYPHSVDKARLCIHNDTQLPWTSGPWVVGNSFLLGLCQRKCLGRSCPCRVKSQSASVLWQTFQRHRHSCLGFILTAFTPSHLLSGQQRSM